MKSVVGRLEQSSYVKACTRKAIPTTVGRGGQSLRVTVEEESPCGAEPGSGGGHVCLYVGDLTGKFAHAQDFRKTVTLEVYVPRAPASSRVKTLSLKGRCAGSCRRRCAGQVRLHDQGDHSRSNGPRTVTSQVDVQPGDFESIDLREPATTIADVEYEPTPRRWSMRSCGWPRCLERTWSGISAVATADPGDRGQAVRLQGVRFRHRSRTRQGTVGNEHKQGVERLVTIEQRDIFTLDLTKGPTIVTLYLLPRLNAKLLPDSGSCRQARAVISVAHRMADIKPDEQVVVDPELGEFRPLSVEGRRRFAGINSPK